MSCEENFDNYTHAQSGAVATALGLSPDEADKFLHRVFDEGRPQWQALGKPPAGDARRVEAEAATRAMFAEMERAGIKPPTHSRDGLPKPDAQFGYLNMHRTLRAIREQRPLPPVARDILSDQQARRRMTAAHRDSHGYQRCSMCGQFVSAANPDRHNCPLTATEDTMERSLRRRLGVPAGAYSSPNGHNGLSQLLAEARQGVSSGSTSAASPPSARSGMAGLITMRHNLTGEEIRATLDGALVALQQGYVPAAWRENAVQVELASGQVVAVLNDKGLRRAPVSGAGGPGSGTAAQQAASAYGVSISRTAPVGSAGSSGASGGAISVSMPVQTPVVPVQVHDTMQTGGHTSVQPPPAGNNGSYDLGRFVGTEFRKGKAGDFVTEDEGVVYTLKTASNDPSNWSSSRAAHGGPHDDPPGRTVRVGRTLPAAMTTLRYGEVVEDPATGRIELYEAHPVGEPLEGQPKSLLAVYDPSTRTAGDTVGTPNASPQQMAAVLAYYALHPDPSNPYQSAWATDFHNYSSGAGGGRLLAAADSAYLVLRNELEAGNSYTLGGQVSTPRCPNCGQFAGSSHACPAIAPTSGTNTTSTGQASPTAASEDSVDASATTETTSTTVAQISTPGAPTAPDSSTAIGSEGGSPLDVPGMSPVPSVPTSDARDVATDEVTSPPQPDVPAPMPVPMSTPTALHVRVEAELELTEQGEQRLGRAIRQGLSAERRARPPGNGRSNTHANTRNGRVDNGGNPSVNTAPLNQPVSLPTTPPNIEQLERLASAFEALYQRLDPDTRPAPASTASAPAPLQASGPVTKPGLEPTVTPTPRPRRRAADDPQRTPVEHIMAHISPPSDPDPYLNILPPHLGGHITEPIPLYYPEADPSFDVNRENERAMHTMATFLETAWNPRAGIMGKKGMQGRSFLLYGPSSSGKNSTARQVAAALSLPYTERTIKNHTRIQDLIGSVVLETDPVSGATVSRARLGPIGLALVSGQVVGINELHKAPPHTQGALQTIIEDGYIEIEGTEAGAHRIPVHPSSVVVCTMNQGVEGSMDRPESAPLARMVAVKIDEPSLEEEARRVLGNMRALFAGLGSPDSPNQATQGGDDNGEAAKAERRAEVLGRSYRNKGGGELQIGEEDVRVATGFFRAVRQLASDRSIGRRSPSIVSPGSRELERFVHTVAVTGDPLFAAEQLKIYCDSGPNFREQWDLVLQSMEPFYGRDGQALNRRQAGQAPVTV